jgi:RNA polymerase sigma-70 factor (ECF subfamily)
MNSDGITCVPPLLHELKVTGVERKPIEHSTSSPGLNGEPNDESLLSEIGGGSKSALGILFRRHRRSVLSVAERILRDASEAEDLCQEVFLLVFQKAQLFDASKGTASSWLIQIAYHRAMNRRQYLAHRQHYNTQELDEQEIGARPQLLIDEITARNLLNRLRDQLSEEQKETLELHFFEGYSLREIAEKTNQKLGNVRHHYYRALQRLRSNLFPQKDA